MKLELITGATASLMQMQLFDPDGKLVCELDNDDASLNSYPVKNGFRIHVSSNRCETSSPMAMISLINQESIMKGFDPLTTSYQGGLGHTPNSGFD